MKKQLLIIVMLVFSIAAKCDENGTCGDGLAYSFVSATNTLKISYTGEGSGKMTDFVYSSKDVNCNAPWYGIRRAVTNVEIQEGVTSIGNHAFREFANLKTVSIPNTVRAIGRLAFYNCESIEDLELPAVLDTVAYGCFGNCFSLKTIKMPDSLPRLAEYMFYYCKKLNSINIPENVSTIAYGAFYMCEKLQTVDIPSKTDSLADFAFCNCRNLSEVDLKEGLKYIGNASFSFCPISTIYIPSTVNKIRQGAFANDFYLWVVDISDLGAWCKINFEWDSNPLTIAHRLSQNHTRYNQLIIPNGVTSIGKYVFDGLHEVYKVDLNKDLKSIGDYAFNDCVDMTQLVIPENVDEIGDGITAGCIGLTYLSVKDNETYDSRNDCNAIIDSKTDVLKAGCKNTIIPNNVKGIGKSAFENCTELKSATIPDGATFIGDKAFYGCTNLTSMSVPNSINHIGESSFQHCSLSEVNIPENIDSIGSSTFAQCPNLKKVNIPNKVKFIGAVAFASCNSLESVIIGENVDSISSHAFVDCTALKTVYCYAEKVPGTYDNVFESSTSDAILYVPEKSLDLYKSMAPWNEFKEILPITQTGIEYVENKDATESQYYTLDGRVHKTKKKGINIIRMNNGKTKKIVVK